MDGETAQPANIDKVGWKAYWMAQGMVWRTEPEIASERQRFLAIRRDIQPNIAHGIYPFKDISLRRADVEWLLATHESGGVRGPVDWKASQAAPPDQRRTGLDLRGADLRGENLRDLPLVSLQGGLHRALDTVLAESEGVTLYQQRAAAIHLEGSDISEAHFEGACLDGANCQEALVRNAYFEGASRNCSAQGRIEGGAGEQGAQRIKESDALLP